MLGVEALSGDATAILLFVALVAFIVAAVVAWVHARAPWATLVAGGLAFVTFVNFWNALAAT